MKIRNITKLFEEATSAATSIELRNNDCDSTTIQVWGTFSDVSLTVQGKTDPDADYVAIGLINDSDYAIVTNGSITKAGIFTIGSDAIHSLKVIINSVSGGNVSVSAMQVNSAEV